MNKRAVIKHQTGNDTNKLAQTNPAIQDQSSGNISADAYVMMERLQHKAQ